MNVIIIPDTPTFRGRHYRIAESLVRKGNVVSFLVWENSYHLHGKELLGHIKNSIISKNYRRDGINIYKISRLPFYWPIINGILFKYQVNRIFKKTSANIIFTQTYTNETEVPKNLPFIYDLSDDYSAPGDLYGSIGYKFAFKLLGIRRTMKRQCKNAQAVTVVSNMLLKYAKKYNPSAVKLENGVDKDTILETLKNTHSHCKNNYSLVYISTFGVWSQVIETMTAVNKLRAKFPKIDLTLIGGGTEESRIVQFINDNNASDYIHFLGFIHDRKEIYKRINKSAIGLNVSVKDKFRDAAFPVKVLEYTALQKKVVSTNLAEVKLLNFPNIFLFSDNKSNSALRDSIEKAISYKNTKADYSEISSLVLNMYSWDSITDRLLAIIRETNSYGQ